MWTHVAAQGCVGLGGLDLGQVLGQRVLMFVLLVVSRVVELKHTERGSDSSGSSALTELA